MRLRSRLILAFGAIAVVPLLIAVPLALRDLRRTLSAELASRTAASTAAARAAVERTSDDVRRAMVEIRDESGLRKAPALVTARAMDYGTLRIHAVGGVLLDQRLAAHLAEITRAQVTLIAGEEAVASAGEAAPPV